jgi:hypothetical protein
MELRAKNKSSVAQISKPIQDNGKQHVSIVTVSDLQRIHRVISDIAPRKLAWANEEVFSNSVERVSLAHKVSEEAAGILSRKSGSKEYSRVKEALTICDEDECPKILNEASQVAESKILVDSLYFIKRPAKSSQMVLRENAVPVAGVAAAVLNRRDNLECSTTGRRKFCTQHTRSSSLKHLIEPERKKHVDIQSTSIEPIGTHSSRTKEHLDRHETSIGDVAGHISDLSNARSIKRHELEREMLLYNVSRSQLRKQELSSQTKMSTSERDDARALLSEYAQEQFKKVSFCEELMNQISKDNERRAKVVMEARSPPTSTPLLLPSESAAINYPNQRNTSITQGAANKKLKSKWEEKWAELALKRNNF